MKKLLKDAGRKKTVIVKSYTKDFDHYLIEYNGKFENISTKELNRLKQNKNYVVRKTRDFKTF